MPFVYKKYTKILMYLLVNVENFSESMYKTVITDCLIFNKY